MINLLVSVAMVAVLPATDSVAPVSYISLEKALEIALSENVSVKIADKEIERTKYARKGTYASLFPQVDVSGSYQRTIKKQMMYMDVDIPGMEIGGGGFEVGRWNTWGAGVSAVMPLVNAQLWESIKISGEEVELAVEKARSSRLETVNQVKQAYYSVLLAKEVFNVYKQEYENSKMNYERTLMKYNVQKSSELDLTRAKSNLAAAIPSVYDSESAIILSLWQLKAVMGVNLDENIDVLGSLSDYTGELFEDHSQYEQASLEYNSTMRQLALQAEQLASAIRAQKAASIPTLSLAFSYSMNANENNYVFKNYKWSPFSYAGLSLSIPIFAGGKRTNAVRQAKVQATELSMQTIDTERQIKIGIRQLLNTMETQTKSFDSAKEATEAARKAYDIATKSYTVGRSTLTDLNDAQLALTTSQLALTKTIYSYLVAKCELEQMLGNDYNDNNN